ncbi:hypothetical protein [Pseudomonas typographi]|uniref:Phage protein n=1 Tax=Pseudomonas typographi TaxID=2715964 RepID=A0ABR7ZAL0_9PSED|nr:hypothetical protein [Pseudomonas typographi]MBD1589766.1 hypothetical protein [Pseudomonas typographi]MBD1602348.1 hypothetical protein [Pseudomonas typographi]
MTRAQRRHDTRRMKARFKQIQKAKDWVASAKNAGVFANHGKVCSCWMCGNPRKLGELTMQEKRADLSEFFD